MLVEIEEAIVAAKQMTEPTDEEIDAIWTLAEHDAIHGHIGSSVNPYHIDDPRAEIYSFAYRTFYAREK